MCPRQVVLLTPPKSSCPTQLLSRQQDAVNPLATTLMNLPASVANKGLTRSLSPLDSALTKNRGWGALLYSRAPSCSEWGPPLCASDKDAHPTRMRILSPPTAEEPTHGSDHVGKDSSPASLLARSFHSLHQECFTTLLHPSASALFLKTAGVSPYK